MGKTRAIGYLRVSTADQVDGFGLQVQERAIRAHAKAAGMRLVAMVHDEGQSGSNGLDTRPGLAEALVRLEGGEADALVVARLDRLARDLVLQETIIGRLRAAGREVLSVAEPDLGGDPTRDLVRQVLGAIAQYERALITARMKAGRDLKRARGGYAGGRPRYGYRAKDGELVREPDEQKAITLARRLHRSGRSYRAIAAELEEAGHRPKGGGVWHPVQVSRLLVNRAV